MTPWTETGPGRYECECYPGYDAYAEIEECAGYAAPWGPCSRGRRAVVTVVERATGAVAAKRAVLPGGTLDDALAAAEAAADARASRTVADGCIVDADRGTLRVARGGEIVAECAYADLTAAAGGSRPGRCLTVEAVLEGDPPSPVGFAARAYGAGMPGPATFDAGPFGDPAEASAALREWAERHLADWPEDDGAYLERYGRLMEGDPLEFARTGIDELVRACRASAQAQAGRGRS